jgi:hypothetical protein
VIPSSDAPEDADSTILISEAEVIVSLPADGNLTNETAKSAAKETIPVVVK